MAGKSSGGSSNTAQTDKVTQAVERGIEAHIASYLRNSDFSRDTPAWNHFRAGLPDLVGLIVKEVTGV